MKLLVLGVAGHDTWEQVALHHSFVSEGCLQSAWTAERTKLLTPLRSILGKGSQRRKPLSGNLKGE